MVQVFLSDDEMDGLDNQRNATHPKQNSE